VEFEEIRQIVELMDEHNLSLFHLEREGINLKLKKGMDADDILPFLQAQNASSYAAQPGPAAPPQQQSAAAAIENPFAATNEKEIASPMVGTFYRSSSPEAGPYASVGDDVSDESVVCIIEAMKVMNEIKAELKGKITKVLVEDGMPVQYGQPLFLVSSD
jgi:acetyl-CoA carboxylase biotin carboxyl carrier protein